MIQRYQENFISELSKGKNAIIIMGARQVGKTTFINEHLIKRSSQHLSWNGDDPAIRKLLEEASLASLRKLIGTAKVLIIDEAQRIENIGVLIKLVVDNIKDVKVIASGSSSFDLANKINEPLTGRKYELIMYPLSWSEMVKHHGLTTEISLLEQRLIYGYYPEVVTTQSPRESLLKSLSDSYLYKDIFVWENILKPDKLERLLQALALQVGNLVSYHELGQMVGLSSETIERYINLLEKSFIIFRLGSFKRNIRAELNKSRKIYFFDNGIRNAVIDNFNVLDFRNDVSALWENFLISERRKQLSRLSIFRKSYFWRTKDQAEIDYIEEGSGVINAFEFKYQNKNFNFNPSFVKTYNPSETSLIHKGNFWEWLE